MTFVKIVLHASLDAQQNRRAATLPAPRSKRNPYAFAAADRAGRARHRRLQSIPRPAASRSATCQCGIAPAGVMRSPVPSTSAAVPARKNGTSDPSARATRSQSRLRRLPALRSSLRVVPRPHRSIRRPSRLATGIRFCKHMRMRGGSPSARIAATARLRSPSSSARSHSKMKRRGWFDAQLVGEFERNHHAADAVIAVVAAAKHLERQIDFRRSPQGEHADHRFAVPGEGAFALGAAVVDRGTL